MVYVTFKMIDEEFALPVDQVKEVVKLPSVIPLPQAPHFVEGIISLRRHSVAVVDLGKRFNISVGHREINRKVLIVKVDRMILGLIVDEVTGVVELDVRSIDQVSKIVNAHLSGNVIRGVAHVGERQILLLELGAFLNTQEKVALEEAKGGH